MVKISEIEYSITDNLVEERKSNSLGPESESCDSLTYPYVGLLLDNEEAARELVKRFTDNDMNKNMVTKKNDSKRLLLECYRAHSRKSQSQGIRNRETNKHFTGCAVMFSFYKQVRGTFKLTSFHLTHNHEVEIRVAYGPRSGGRGFDWNTTADAIVRDGVISEKSVPEMLELMKNEGISPLPSPLTISKRVSLVKKSMEILGIPKKPRGRPR